MKNAKPTEDQVRTITHELGVEDQTWVEIGAEAIKLVDLSNLAYGDSTERSAKIMGLLYPEGIQPDQLHDARCMVSILDKLSRIATDKDAFGESPWRDVIGYAMLAYRHELNRNPDRER